MCLITPKDRKVIILPVFAVGSSKNLGSFAHTISFCCRVCTVPHSELKDHEKQGEYHKATHQSCASNLHNSSYTNYKLGFAKFHERQMALYVYKQIFPLTGKHADS